MSKIVPRVAESAQGERSTQLPDVNNSNSEPEPTMSRLYKRSSDVEASLRPRTNKLCSTSDAQATHSPPQRVCKGPLCQVLPTPRSQTLMKEFPCERESTIAHSKSVLRSSPHDGPMKPVNQVRKSRDEASPKELHSPTFRSVLGLCQTNAVPPPSYL